MQNELLKLIEKFDIISFDLFDTLLLRPYLKPSDLWRDLEERENADGFASDRLMADGKLYTLAQKKAGDPTLDEIYGELPQWTHMKSKELALESNVIIANPEMLDVWREAGNQGKKRILVSDMYLPKDFLEKVLLKNGISNWDALYVSCDMHLKKRTQTLYLQILKETGCPPDRILHIGDDETADVLMPNRAGIVAFRYGKIVDKFLIECPFMKPFLENGKSWEKEKFAGCLACGWHKFKCDYPDWSYWNKIGFIFAGTLGYIYVKFVGELAKKRGFTHLMMTARDCYIPEKILHRLYPEIKTSYFYASRVSAMLSTGYSGSTTDCMITRRDFYIKHIKEEIGASVSDIDARNFVETGILPKNLEPVFAELRQKERVQTEQYFSTFPIHAQDTAIVDGTSGHFTVQKFVSDITGKDLFTFYIQTPIPPGHGASLFQSSWLDARYLLFSEFLFSAPYPPVIRVAGGKPVFKEIINNFERIKIDISKQLEAGALAFADMLNRQKCCLSKFVWLDLNDAFMDNPTIEDKQMMSIACDSIAPDHDCEFVSVLRKRPKPDSRSKFLLGIKIGTIRNERICETYHDIFYLFDRFKIRCDSAFFCKFLPENGFVRKFYRQIMWR